MAEDTNEHLGSSDCSSVFHVKAQKIIAQALAECSHPTLTKTDHEGNAKAILYRLSLAGITFSEK